ncbi:hypothetical protein ACTMU2_27450 [Cupriavidus basilensis]
MTTRDDDLRPEEFAQAASAAVHDALPRNFREAARAGRGRPVRRMRR